jgi:hypothetical protein
VPGESNVLFLLDDSGESTPSASGRTLTWRIGKLAAGDIIGSVGVATVALFGALCDELPADPQKGLDVELTLSAANTTAPGFTATHGLVATSESQFLDGHTEAAGTMEMIG